jgi:hypothetical protein
VLSIKVRAYRADRHLISKLLVDLRDLVLNLVDTLRGRDDLQTSIPGALELANSRTPAPGCAGWSSEDRNLMIECSQTLTSLMSKYARALVTARSVS